MRRYVLMSTVALMAFALPHYAQAASAGQTQPPRAAASPDTATQQFVRKAATGNIFEIQAAQTAEQKVSNPAYRDFAQMIITDHTNMGDRLKNVVKNVPGLQLPQALDQKDQQELQKLKTEGGATFERQYRANQIDDHQQDIKLFQNYADNGTNPQLKTWADQEVSMLQKHLDRAEALPMPQVTNRRPAVRKAGGQPDPFERQSCNDAPCQQCSISGERRVKRRQDDAEGPAARKPVEEGKGSLHRA